MSAIARFKEYFGMAPVAAYDDEYLDDYDRPVHHDVRAPRGIHETDDLGPVARDRRDDYGYAADRYLEEPAPRTRIADLDPVDERPVAPRRGDIDEPAPARAATTPPRPGPAPPCAAFPPPAAPSRSRPRRTSWRTDW
ncbi:hypothetical protein OVA21_05445 [Dietzia sp. SL131]|uniref:hypothetical protein n=1 Tax=Dietzia sp. SL131 TaxID=2995149 RepID=UPI0022753CBD|nr:hypothetical protein [Dietzia sp. SL131]MCY1656652.1 hypothetical protein [Dietzia sp. SL131]